MKDRVNSTADPEKVFTDNTSFSGENINILPDPLVAKRHSCPNGGAGGVSPLTSQPDTAYILIDSPIINHVDRVTPGYGQPDPKCGTVGSRSVRATVQCPDNPAHYKRAIFDSCHRPACPVCWPSWRDRAADRIVDTVTGFKKAHGYEYYPNHIDITPDPTIVPFDKPSVECLNWLLEEVNMRLDVLGVIAAALIPHPYRIRNEWKRYVNDMASAEHENRYTWALRQDNWYEYIYFSPHVHAICYGKLRLSPDFYKLTGWQYHNHGRTKTREDVLKVARYTLSHAWVRGNFKTVRYVRGMSSTKLLVNQEKDERPDTCPVCGAHAVRVPYFGRDANGNDIVPFQDLHNCDKAYKVVIMRTVSAKISIAALLDRTWAAAAAWIRRYYRDHSMLFCYTLHPVTA